VIARTLDLTCVEKSSGFGDLRIERSLPFRHGLLGLVDAEPGFCVAAVDEENAGPDVNRLVVEPARKKILSVPEELGGPGRNVRIVLWTKVDLVFEIRLSSIQDFCPRASARSVDLLVKYTAFERRMVVFPSVELVPNVSEGRSERVISEIAAGFAGGEGIELLDRHSDPSHNRSVLTAVSEPDSIPSAAIRLVERAVARIDLRSHRGVHPRIGAVDVLPLVPLFGFPREDVRRLADQVGRAVAETFGLPVFLYADSAVRPENRELPRLRRGGFEGLDERMRASELVPDYGPNRPHPTAGAVAVGARPLLIAYNVELKTPDRAAAQAIARRVRGSSGGLLHLKALGFELSNPARAQVSMNLTDFQVTSLLIAFDAVEREAARLGVEVAGSEIVGLIPEAASFEGMVERLSLKKPPGILEERIREAGLA
jgi:glutamate formiminotransferase / 5-formyltetrahydrofolate cyclo-ligase